LEAASIFLRTSAGKEFLASVACGAGERGDSAETRRPNKIEIETTTTVAVELLLISSQFLEA
jgi:hypothetical protein